MARILDTSLRQLSLSIAYRVPHGAHRLAALAALGAMIAARSVFAIGIQGTMSNFDVFNETGGNVYGAEIDLEGVHANEVTRTYPAHFTTMTKTEVAMGTTFGTKLVFTGYTFNPPNAFIIPRVGQTTNGHYAVNLPGCEHFGFSLVHQPTKTSFFWLNQNSVPVTAALSIPMPTWTYVPAAGAAPAMMQAVLAPVPPPPALPYPDAVWIKTYVTELPGPADLMELISYDGANPNPALPSVAPQLPSQVEAEWELLPGDAPLAEPDISLADANQSVVRRFEYYKYTGTYDEFHLPNSLFTGGIPDPGELGQFIAANMVAVNQVQPGSCCVVVAGTCSVTSQPDCAAGSVWTSGGSCVPNPCALPTGACCTATHCTIASQSGCAGNFQGVGSVCGPAGNPTTCCPANFNRVNGLEVQDIFDFINAWFAGCTAVGPGNCRFGSADFNGNGLAVQDIFDYLNTWFAGCP
jgi:hypothetical protein